MGKPLFDRKRFAAAAKQARTLNGHRVGVPWNEVTACTATIVRVSQSGDVPDILREATAAAFGVEMVGRTSNHFVRHFLEPFAARIAQPGTVDKHDQKIAVMLFEALAR